jgi:hypothetical protein
MSLKYVKKNKKPNSGTLLIFFWFRAEGSTWRYLLNKVIQVGIPSDKDQYIHRLGRTARAGKEGSGILIYCPLEAHWVRTYVRARGGGGRKREKRIEEDEGEG